MIGININSWENKLDKLLMKFKKIQCSLSVNVGNLPIPPMHVDWKLHFHQSEIREYSVASMFPQILLLRSSMVYALSTKFGTGDEPEWRHIEYEPTGSSLTCKTNR